MSMDGMARQEMTGSRQSPQKREKGVLIVFEGIDGTGKSTQLQLLADYLRQQGHTVVTTKEPTEGKYGRRIRELYRNRTMVTKEEELELFLLDRRDHVHKVLGPALCRGETVLCDRYYLSTIAYQGAAGMDIDDIAAKNAFAPRPDLALVFQLPPESSIARIMECRGEVPNDFEQRDYLRKVEKIFNSLSFSYIEYIDADHSIDTVQRMVQKHVDRYLSANTPKR